MFCDGFVYTVQDTRSKKVINQLVRPQQLNSRRHGLTSTSVERYVNQSRRSFIRDVA